MSRRTAAAVCTTALLAATGLGLAGCSSVNRALDCAKTAATVAGDIQDLQNSLTNAGPATVDSLDRIQDDLNGLGDRTNDADVNQAVTRLETAVRDARTSAAAGKTPDLRPVTSAASGLTDVCTPG
jgi:hypothetical protein